MRAQVFSVILCSSLLAVSGCKQSREQRVKNFVAHNCAQYPIDLYLAEKDRGIKIYQFGPQDQRFRTLLERLWQGFIRQGTDITGSAKLELVNRYLPNYLGACQQFYSAMQQRCSQKPLPSESFRQCMQPYHESYQRQMRALVLAAGEAPVDLDRIELTAPSQQDRTKP